MTRQKNLLAHLLDAFPPRRFRGNATLHADAAHPDIDAAFDDASWWSVPAEFVRQHAALLPLLSREAYIAFFPAWLREAVEEPGGAAAGVVMAELKKPEVAAYFSHQQAYAVMQMAAWIAEHPAHHGALDGLDRIWRTAGG